MTRPDGRSVDQARDQIKSRERVRDLAEVYTHKREVDAMLDLIPDMFREIDSRFLEPACGHGNFVAEILARKLRLISATEHGGTPSWYEYAVLRCASSIYAIDISDENVLESRARMRSVISEAFNRRGDHPTPDFLRALTVILVSNIVQGDTLNGAKSIQFIEWAPSGDETFARTPFDLEEPEHNLFFVPPQALPPIHYSKITSAFTR